jgi:hypothetical protein
MASGDNHLPPYILTIHAATAIAERGLDLAWVKQVLRRPNRTELDRNDPTLRHALGRIAERDDRVLRGVYNETVIPWRVVTAYFDRTQRRQR